MKSELKKKKLNCTLVAIKKKIIPPKFSLIIFCYVGFNDNIFYFDVFNNNNNYFFCIVIIFRQHLFFLNFLIKKKKLKKSMN
jgi:hypothetical protein